MTIERTPLLELPPSLKIGAPDATADGSGGVRRGKGDGGGNSQLVLGIDGGGTKTLAAVLDVGARRVCLGHAGPSNEDSVGAEAAVEALLQAAREAVGAAGVQLDSIDAAVLAVAGTDTDAIARHLHQQVDGGWTVVNDVVGAWATATGARPGVGAISGTGSNVLGVGRDGRTWRAGGWGHVLGDEGSGYWIGLRSISAALRDRDGSGRRTKLTEAALRFFEVSSIEALASLVYSKPLSKSEIASFAVETAKAADGGDAVAIALYALGASELGSQIAAVIAETGLEGQFPVGLIGSAFKAGEVFVGPLRKAVESAAPAAIVSVVEAPPVSGSLMLALSACGAPDVVQAGELQELVETTLRASAAAS